MALLRRKLVLAVLVAFILTLLVILVLALLILLVAILVVVLVLAVVLVLVLIVAHDFTPFLVLIMTRGIKFLIQRRANDGKAPKEFLSVMEPLLGGNYSDFIQSFLQPPYRAVRLNPLKITAEKAAAVLPFRLSPDPLLQ